MSDIKNDRMLSRIVYMIYAKKVIEILEQQKRVYFNNEMTRRFMIGVLISIDKRFEACGSNPFKITEEGILESELMLLRTNPFMLGCLLGHMPDVQMETDSTWNGMVGAANNEHLKVAKRLWQRFNLKPEDYQLFLSPIDSFSPSAYITIYHELYEYKKQMDAVDEKDLADEVVKKEALKYEEACVKYAERFYKKWLRSIWKWEFQLGQKFSAKKRLENKWSADAVKMDYYQKRWCDICKKAGIQNDMQLELFFEGLRKEIEDVSARSGDMLKKRNKEQRKIIWFPFWATVFNAVAAGVTGICDFVFEEEGMPLGWQVTMKVIPFSFAVAATVFSALLTANNLFKEHHAYEETWLRHQLNLSRLTGELEKFCEGLGVYSGVNSAESEKVIDAIRTFQRNIYLLRKQDYANFFNNMNCINYVADFELENAESAYIQSDPKDPKKEADEREAEGS